MDNGVAIRTDKLTRRFGRTLAVDGLDLEVPRGCVLGLAGRNGAGKTTAIRALVGGGKQEGTSHRGTEATEKARSGNVGEA